MAAQLAELFSVELNGALSVRPTTSSIGANDSAM